MANVNSILTQTQTEFNQAVNNGSTGNNELGKEQFLQLLVTQLQNQDPLNPMEDQEFIAQMAQFSSLEQLMNLNVSMQGLTDATNNQQMFSATNYIGKNSTEGADGEIVSEITPFYYTFNAPTTSTTITVYDAQGNPVYVENLDAKDGGTVFKFQWDGKNNSGETMPDGTYTVAVTAKDADGEAVLCTPMVADKVTDILRDGSTIYLRLEGGQTLKLSDVELVSASRPSIATDGSEDEDKGDGSEGGDGSGGTDGDGGGTEGGDGSEGTGGTEGSGTADGGNGTDTGSRA